MAEVKFVGKFPSYRGRGASKPAELIVTANGNLTIRRDGEQTPLTICTTMQKLKIAVALLKTVFADALQDKEFQRIARIALNLSTKEQE